MLTAIRIATCLPLLVTVGCTSQLAALPTAGFERAYRGDATQLASELAQSLAAQKSLHVESSFQTAVQSGGNETDPTDIVLKDSDLLDKNSVRADAAEPLANHSMDAESLLDVSAVNAPLDALMFTLATEAGYSLQLNGQLRQGVTLKASQVTLTEVLDQLALQVPFAWHLDSDSLTLWNGEAFPYSYPVDYLNMDRVTRSSVGLATQVGTINASNESGGSIANSSQTRIENTSEHRFWASLHADVQQLMQSLRERSTGDDEGARFSINAEAGLLTLYATPLVHRSVKQYLTRLQTSARRQVLIEATVVEVALSDSFEAGVDWQILAAGVNGLSAVQALAGLPVVNAASVNRVASPAGLVSLVQSSGRGDISATLSLLEQFGDIRILSRPRIIALNNQSSVLKVVDNRVYFTAKVERSRSESIDEIVTETEIHTVPVGLVMNVTPQISASGSVMLNVRPTLSRILGFVNDPNPELAQANVRNGVPEIQVREMESMLNVQSGQVAIIGGLMQETSEQSDSRLPGLGSLPFFGHVFSQRGRKHRQTELLIVLRPTVVTAGVQSAGAG